MNVLHVVSHMMLVINLPEFHRMLVTKRSRYYFAIIIAACSLGGGGGSTSLVNHTSSPKLIDSAFSVASSRRTSVNNVPLPTVIGQARRGSTENRVGITMCRVLVASATASNHAYEGCCTISPLMCMPLLVYARRVSSSSCNMSRH